MAQSSRAPIPVADVREAALALSPADRRALVDALLAVEEPDPDCAQAWSQELNRRAAEMDSGAVVGIPWEEVRDSTLARLRSRSKT